MMGPKMCPETSGRATAHKRKILIIAAHLIHSFHEYLLPSMVSTGISLAFYSVNRNICCLSWCQQEYVAFHGVNRNICCLPWCQQVYLLPFMVSIGISVVFHCVNRNICCLSWCQQEYLLLFTMSTGISVDFHGVNKCKMLNRTEQETVKN
jgi:hypothetical protein